MQDGREGWKLLPNLQVWVTVAWLLYLVPLCSWIVLQKREPVATLSWLLSLALPRIRDDELAAADGVVGKVLAAKGDSLVVDQAIVEFA